MQPSALFLPLFPFAMVPFFSMRMQSPQMGVAACMDEPAGLMSGSLFTLACCRP